MRPLLGTFVELVLVLPERSGLEKAPSSAEVDAQQVAPLFDGAFTAIARIQQLMSFHDANSELSRLNLAPTGQWVSLSPLTLRILRLAKAMMRVSNGHFNCTLAGALVTAGVLPNHGFKNFVAVGGVEDLHLACGQAKLSLPALLTLDGMAKGLAVDMAIAQLRRGRVQGGWVNAGGDIRVFGEMALPVQYRGLNGEIGSLGGLQNAAIATSSSVSSQRYPGLLLTGRGELVPPSQWSVLAHTAWRADALTKVAASVPAEFRVAEVARLGGTLVCHELA